MILPNCERCLIPDISFFEWTRRFDVNAVCFFDVQIEQRRRVVTFPIDRVVRTKPSHQEVRNDRVAVACNRHFSKTPLEESSIFAWERPVRHSEEMAVASRGWRRIVALARNLVRSVWHANRDFGGPHEVTGHAAGSSTGGKRVAALDTRDVS